MVTNPLSTIEECRNEFADIRRDAVVPLLERAVAESNNQAVPEDVTTKLRELGERLYLARVAYAGLNEAEIIPERPGYLTPAVNENP